MGRLKLDVLFLITALVVVNCVVQCQYYNVENPKPIYIVDGAEGSSLYDDDDSSMEDEPSPQSQFMSRSGAASSQEESDEVN
jgi:hypothetical protein